MTEIASLFRRSSLRAASDAIFLLRSSLYCTSTGAVVQRGNLQGKEGKWLTLPPFTSSIDPSSIGKEILHPSSSNHEREPTTALKWVLRCCPQLPRSLVQKLFRLRQVRRESSSSASSSEVQVQQHQRRRVSAKTVMEYGDRICLPITVKESQSAERPGYCTEDEIRFIRSIELYKDPAIIVVNKPAGMPVQGGIGIRKSLDALAATALRYDYPDPPRLVHRLDRDSSGILVMGRTQTSTTVLHSIFREKTVGASVNEVGTSDRILQRRYWALVFGTPKRPEGLISAPLAKVALDDGKSERITIVDDRQNPSSQHAITEYRVIKNSDHGFTWLELSPITGRKHQLRVHCAEVLGTPIVGDFKYGWRAHRKWKPISLSNHNRVDEYPESNGCSITEKEPTLHLHCRHMTLPDVAHALEQLQFSSHQDLSKLGRFNFIAPLPSHMQRSWDLLNCGPVEEILGSQSS
ncbi:hypothetical protein H6P81_020532 [Aristolochia fimbriata]|uniref:Pseudouridine synthase RsuA/RluA-like domain-containing protein n=1 Tax=Aristolochia fimbriata TaxID=158543 RepID=A0AAV7DZ20_ARIFI|nr:hypothetical protein H6P81_020532 [Aristolochia fimbriata]